MKGALYGTDIYECARSGSCCWYAYSFDYIHSWRSGSRAKRPWKTICDLFSVSRVLRGLLAILQSSDFTVLISRTGIAHPVHAQAQRNKTVRTAPSSSTELFDGVLFKYLGCLSWKCQSLLPFSQSPIFSSVSRGCKELSWGRLLSINWVVCYEAFVSFRILYWTNTLLKLNKWKYCRY